MTEQKPSIPHELVLEHIFPFALHDDFEKQVMRAIITRNLQNLYLLLGPSPVTVQPYLLSKEKYAEAAGFSIILPVLRRLGFKLSAQIFSKAARCGNLSCMKWLKENGCPWDQNTFASAAINRDLINMKWLLENGCPRDEMLLVQHLRWLIRRKNNISNTKVATKSDASQYTFNAYEEWLVNNQDLEDEEEFEATAAESSSFVLLNQTSENIPLEQSILGHS